MKISPARVAAFEILSKIEIERAHSSILLPKYEANLDRRDRALCHAITLGVLRKKLYLDELIRLFTKKDPSKFDVGVLIALRIGIFQLEYLDRIPAHSAINESVNLVKRARKKSAVGLVNAVLRRFEREGESLEFADPVAELSIKTSHPVWLIERWTRQFGEAQTQELANANNAIPRHYFRITKKFLLASKDVKDAVLEAIEQSSGERTESEVPGRFFVDKINADLLDLAEAGLIHFQDAGSQMVADIVAGLKGRRILDVCAAPGNKTSMITMACEGESELIVAGDLHKHRIISMRNALEKQESESVRLVQYDAAVALPFMDESFDVILVDAPCSGTGTIRSNPEIRYSISESDIIELSKKQLSILECASRLLTRRGALVYATCSLEPEEGEGVCQIFVDRNPNFHVEKVSHDSRYSTERGHIRTFPHKDQMDGFFVAVIRRTAL